MDLIESARKFIAIDSTPSQGNHRLVDCAAQFCLELGLTVEIQEEVSGDLKQANIFVRPTSSKENLEFLLQTHLDTSDPGPFGMWAKTDFNPFDAHIIENRIYGLGSADTKLDFICKMLALAEFKNQKMQMPPVLVGTFGEETGMMGALKLIRKNKISTRYALIGEPTNLQLHTAGKGFASVEIILPFEADEKKFRIEHNLSEGTSTQSRLFHGKTAHSSAPHEGESAVRKMFDYLMQLPEDLAVMEIDGGVSANTVPAQAFLEVDPVSGFAFPMSKKLGIVYREIQALEQNFLKYQDARFSPAAATLSIGLVRTSEEQVMIYGNCRMPPVISTEVYEQWMGGLKKVCEQVGGTFRIHDYKKPYQTNENSVFVRGAQSELRELGQSDKLGTHSSTNEASLFSRVGVECISFGPGEREGNIHTPNENVAVRDLMIATDFYKKMIKRFCL